MEFNFWQKILFWITNLVLCPLKSVGVLCFFTSAEKLGGIGLRVTSHAAREKRGLFLPFCFLHLETQKANISDNKEIYNT